MKYKTKIVPEGTGYVGYLYLNNEIIYKTNESVDPILLSREISNYVATLDYKPLHPKQPLTQPIITTKLQPVVSPTLTNVSNSSLPPPPVNTQPVYSPPRRCCGRG